MDAIRHDVAQISRPAGRRLPMGAIVPAVLLFILVGCLLSTLVVQLPPPVGGKIMEANQAPFAPGHLLGTDINGNDVLSRLLHGGRTSLFIALAVNLIGLTFGGLLGAGGAYLGGVADSVVTRVLDAFIAFPSLILVLAVAQALGPGELHTVGALAFFSVPAFARVARAETLRLREEPFILAARLSGTGFARVLLFHVAPNILPQLATFALLGMGAVINIEGAVSFLGLGIPAPAPSWGNMIYQGQVMLSSTPLLVIAPSVFLFVTVLCFNLLGEALRAGAENPSGPRSSRSAASTVSVPSNASHRGAPSPGAFASSTAEPVLRVDGLTVRFDVDGRRLQAVDGLSFSLHAGQALAIIGESGSGKTVSCRSLMGLLPGTAFASGSALLEGRQLLGLSEREMRKHRGSGIAMIFQDPTRSLNPSMRVGHQIAETVRLHHSVGRDDCRRRAIELLDQLRVPAARQRFHAFPHELSGGMRQRVMIAIALAGNPRVLVADEATRSLDAITQASTLALLKQLQRERGMALIMISHDLRLAAGFADDILVMYAGRAVEYAPAGRIFEHARMRYTRALLDAMPHPGRPPHSRMQVIGGHPPDLTALPAGCAFEPRCASARNSCRLGRVPLEEQERGHWCACAHPCERSADA